jgi:hypothetical protein
VFVLDFVKLLLQDPRVDPSDSNSKAIEWAAAEGRVDIVKFVLQNPMVSRNARL